MNHLTNGSNVAVKVVECCDLYTPPPSPTNGKKIAYDQGSLDSKISPMTRGVVVGQARFAVKKNFGAFGAIGGILFLHWAFRSFLGLS